MRRKDGPVKFDREWEDYTFGFGALKGEFWAGIWKWWSFIYLLLDNGTTVSLVHFGMSYWVDWNNNHWYKFTWKKRKTHFMTVH